jgi:excisionase family DNA binding protein
MRTLTTIPTRPPVRSVSPPVVLPLAGVPARPRLPAVRHRGAHRGLGMARALGEHQPSTDPLLTADEVAALLRVTKAWVYTQTRAQQIPHVPLGRYVRYRRSAVIDWIAALERQSSRGVRVPLGRE